MLVVFFTATSSSSPEYALWLCYGYALWLQYKYTLWLYYVLWFQRFLFCLLSLYMLFLSLVFNKLVCCFYIPGCSNRIKDFLLLLTYASYSSVKRCLTRDVSRRPTTTELLSHPYLLNYDKPTQRPSLATLPLEKCAAGSRGSSANLGRCNDVQGFLRSQLVTVSPCTANAVSRVLVSVGYSSLVWVVIRLVCSLLWISLVVRCCSLRRMLSLCICGSFVSQGISYKGYPMIQLNF